MTSTRPFPTAVVLTLATGTMLCDSFGDMHELAEFMADQPLFIHQFTSPELCDALRTELIRQHPWLAGAIENTPDFTQVPHDYVETACHDWVQNITLWIGPTVPIAQVPDFPHPSFMARPENLSQGRQA